MSDSPNANKLTGPYVLVTPTRNEEASIAVTIECVVNQTRRPAEWVIVSDGSTDRTDQIVRSAAGKHPWIRLHTLPARPDRSFAAVVHATDAGVRALATRAYDYLGLLDSDVRFEADYFEKVIRHFEASPRLGLAGGVVIDLGQPKDRLPRNRGDVPGAVQFFRRRCFEELGGLVAIPEGGWDALTCARARMLGYETRLLTDLVVDHLKPRNVSAGGVVQRQWQLGRRDYALGYHPLFELFKCMGRALESPVLAGAGAWWLGYCFSAIMRRKRLIPEDLMQFVRDEQIARIRRLVGIPARKAARQSSPGAAPRSDATAGD